MSDFEEAKNHMLVGSGARRESWPEGDVLRHIPTPAFMHRDTPYVLFLGTGEASGWVPAPADSQAVDWVLL